MTILWDPGITKHNIVVTSHPCPHIHGWRIFPGYLPSDRNGSYVFSVYGDHLHRNDRTDLYVGMSENTMWQRRWWSIRNLPMRWYNALQGRIGHKLCSGWQRSSRGCWPEAVTMSTPPCLCSPHTLHDFELQVSGSIPRWEKLTSGYHNYLLKGLKFWYMYCSQKYFSG